MVRYNGGPQAAHNVELPDGREHTFAQFGSASFIPGVRTYLSRFMLVEPLSLFREYLHLQQIGVYGVLKGLLIDERATVITPFHKAVNRLREMNRGQRHGSCGIGFGEAVSDKLNGIEITVGELRGGRKTLRNKLIALREHKRSQVSRPLPTADSTREELLLCQDVVIDDFIDVCQELVRKVHIVDAEYLKLISKLPGTIIFEGAQGVLLDEWHGFHPHTTWSTTTSENAQTLLRESGFAGETKRVGVIRAYATRHGVGPFPTEYSPLSGLLKDKHNITNPWQQNLRYGWLDLVLLRYALLCNGGIDALAVTCMDDLDKIPRPLICVDHAYDLKDDCAELEPNFSHDVAGQEVRITNRLSKCHPMYDNLQKHELVEILERELLTTCGHLRSPHVELLSYGPTWKDKKYIREAVTS